MPGIIAIFLAQADAKILAESAKITGLMKDEFVRELNDGLDEKIDEMIGEHIRQLNAGLDTRILEEVGKVVDMRLIT